MTDQNRWSEGARGRARIVGIGAAILAWLALGRTFGSAPPAEAHEKHTKHAPMRPQHMSSADTIVRGESPVSVIPVDTLLAEPPFKMPPVGEAIGHHLHNKLVHFPIVLTPLALLTLFLSPRRPELFDLARALAWAAAVSAGAALWAGLAQSSDFSREPKEWLVLVHRNWGIATTAALSLTALLTLLRRTWRYAWVMALLAFVLVSIGGYLGGLVSHG